MGDIYLYLLIKIKLKILQAGLISCCNVGVQVAFMGYRKYLF